MKIGVIWWKNVRGNKTRGHVKCFEDAGYETISTHGINIYKDDYDFVFTPYSNLDTGEIPLVFQFGGYGEPIVLPDKEPKFGILGSICRKSDIMLCLDPKIYDEIKYGLDQTKPLYLVPNNITSFSENDINEELISKVEKASKDKFVTLFPSGDWDIKKPEMIMEAITEFNKKYDKENHLFIFISSINDKEKIIKKYYEFLEYNDNFIVIGRQSHGTIKKLYELSDIVSLYSYAEISPNIFFESMDMGKCMLVHPNSPGKVQSIHSDFIKDVSNDFGTDIRTFNKKWENDYYTGDNHHYKMCETPEILAEQIDKFSKDEKLYKNMCEEAKKWAEEYKNSWPHKKRGETIVKLFEELKKNE